MCFIICSLFFFLFYFIFNLYNILLGISNFIPFWLEKTVISGLPLFCQFFFEYFGALLTTLNLLILASDTPSLSGIRVSLRI